MKLNRTIGLPMLTFYGTGMILGAGIYSIIGQAAGIAGDTVWQSFLLAALAAFLTALSYAELATMYPTAGGEYIYLRKAFTNQRWLAASVGITVVFAGSASAATVSLAFASYLQHFANWPHLLTAATLLIVFTFVNIIGIRQSGWINAAFTVIEATGLILFIWLGWQQPEFGNALFTMPNSTTLTSAGLIIFAYLGFENIVSLAEETKKPEITIPRAIILSLVISTVLYVLVSFAALGLMPAKQLALSESSLVNAAMVGSKPIASIIGGIALFSTANTALICLITASRILYGISKDHSLPSLISKTHATLKTPWVAALVALFIALILLPIRSVETLANISSFATMIAFISVNIALIYLRRSEKNMARPFRIPFSIKKVPVLPLLAIFSCVVFLFQFSKSIYLTGTLVFILSAGLYFFYQLFKTKKSA